MRDLCTWVHMDTVYDAYYNACLILLGMKARVNPGNPYINSTTQLGFATFGAPHVLSLLGEVATRALRYVWYQKWFVHRRLRPEDYGGLVHLTATGQKSYPIHPDMLHSSVLNTVSNKTGSYLLPMAYVEGCPIHPSYGQGHGVIAGACVTVLKSWFAESGIFADPMAANEDGTSLDAYSGHALTVGNELNKLAGNIGHGRDMAGVHFRSDYWQGLLLGEKLAISILNDQAGMFNEPCMLEFTGFDGHSAAINGDR